MDRGSGTLIRTELKEVTVLFADIVNSMRLIETMDPERASDVLDPVLTIMIDAVRAQGGTITSIQGDGVMAIFGAPLALEDHAVRACSAAIEIRDRHLRQQPNITEDVVKIRIGLDSGQILLRTYDSGSINNYDAVGLVVHLANKLEEQAKPNSIQISGRTERLVRGLFTVESSGFYPLKSSQYEVFCLTEAFSLSPWTIRQSRVLCEVIGRENFLLALKNRLHDLLRRIGGSVLLEAEAGLGKSRLLYEFSRACRQQDVGLLRIEGKLHQQKTMLQPFRGLLAEILAIDSQEELSTIRKKLSVHLRRYNLNTIDHEIALASLFDPDIQTPRWKNADPDWRRETVIAGIVETIAAMARETPLVFMAEDAHLMDRSSVDVIRRLARIARDAGILLIISQRSREMSSISDADADHVIHLPPLTRAEAGLLCDALLGNDSQLDRLKSELVRSANGVPLFIEEIVLDLFDAGVVRGAIGSALRGPDASDVDAIQIPSSVTVMLAARIDRLALQCRDLLRIASVIGERFPRELLRTASAFDDTMFDAMVEQLIDSKLVIATDNMAESSLTFSHALTQQVSYRSMVATRRQEYHALVAGAMKNYYGNRIHEYTEDLAHHYSEAGEIETAIDLWQETAQRSLFEAANIEAVDALQRAIELVDNLPRDERALRRRLKLMTLQGSALIILEGPGSDEVGRIYAQCAEIADSIGATRDLFRSIWGQWRVAWKLSSKFAFANQLLELAHQSGDEEQLLQAHHAHWVTCFNLGELKKSLEYISSGLALYERSSSMNQQLYYGGHDPVVCGYGEAALCHWILGDVAKGCEMARAAVEHARQTKHPGSIGHALDYALFFAEHIGDTEEVMRLSSEAIDFAQEMALPHYGARAKAWRGWAIAHGGELRDGIQQMEAAIDWQRHTGVEEDFPVFLEVLAGLKERLGDWRGALHSCDEAMQLANQSGMRHWLAEIHRRRGSILRRLGPRHYDDALVALEIGLHIAEEQRAQSFVKRLREDLRSLREAKDAEQAYGVAAAEG